MVDKSNEAVGFVKKLQTRAIAVIAIAAICALTVFAAVSSSYTVKVYDGKEMFTVVTTQSDPMQVLSEANVKVGKSDKVDLSQFVSGKDGKITVNRVHNLTVETDGKKQTFVSAGPTVKEALADSHISTENLNITNFSLSSKIYEGMIIEGKYSPHVSITADGKTCGIAADGTVADALKKAGIACGKDDMVNPSLQTALAEGMKITVSRVTYSQASKEEAIPYSVEKENSGSLYQGETEVKVQGVNGLKKVTYNNKYVDGKIAESKAVSEATVKQPVAQKVVYGTRSVRLAVGHSISELETPDWLKIGSSGAPTSYKSYVDGKAVAYSGGGYTASGRKTKPGYIAVNPKQFPYGTKLYITSLDGKYVYGYAIAADTGGFVSQGTATCDLYMNTTAQCCQWGARQVRIYVL